MDGRRDWWTDGLIDGWVNGQNDEFMHYAICIDGWMNGWMHDYIGPINGSMMERWAGEKIGAWMYELLEI